MHAHAVVLPITHVQGQNALRALPALLTLLHDGSFLQSRHHVPLTVLSPCHHDPPIPDLQMQGRLLLLATTVHASLNVQGPANGSGHCGRPAKSSSSLVCSQGNSLEGDNTEQRS